MVSPSSSRSISARDSTAERSHASTTAARIRSCRRRTGSSSQRGSSVEGLSVIVLKVASRELKFQTLMPSAFGQAALELFHLGGAADDERRALMNVARLDVENLLPAVAGRAAG